MKGIDGLKSLFIEVVETGEVITAPVDITIEDRVTGKLEVHTIRITVEPFYEDDPMEDVDETTQH